MCVYFCVQPLPSSGTAPAETLELLRCDLSLLFVFTCNLPVCEGPLNQPQRVLRACLSGKGGGERLWSIRRGGILIKTLTNHHLQANYIKGCSAIRGGNMLIGFNLTGVEVESLI